MPTNPITLKLVEQISGQKIKIAWSHKLQPRVVGCDQGLCFDFPAETVSLLSVQTQVTRANGSTFWQSINSSAGANLTSVYYKKTADILVPRPYGEVSVVYYRLLLMTSRGNAFSNVIAIDPRTVPLPPKNVRAIVNNNVVTIKWDETNEYGGYGLESIGYEVQYTSDEGITWFSKTYSGIGPIAPEFINTVTFDSLTPNKYYIFRVVATNPKGKSDPSSATFPIFIESDVTNVLFDKTSWSSVPSPWKEYLTFAATEWEKYIKINPSVANTISDFDNNFTGIKLDTYNTVSHPSTNGVVKPASIEINNVINLGGFNRFSVKAMPLSFNLTINTHADVTNTLNADQLKAVMVHQLGHALGLGLFWQRNWLTKLNKSVASAGFEGKGGRWQLKGTFTGNYYTNAQKAYNTLFNFQNPRVVMPLAWNSTLNDINKVGHWAYNRNTSSPFTTYHPPIPQDIMTYGHLGNPSLSTATITKVTLGALLDFGYMLANNYSPNYTTSLTLPTNIETNDISLSNIDTAIITANIELDSNNEVKSATFFDV